MSHLSLVRLLFYLRFINNQCPNHHLRQVSHEMMIPNQLIRKMAYQIQADSPSSPSTPLEDVEVESSSSRKRSRSEFQEMDRDPHSSKKSRIETHASTLFPPYSPPLDSELVPQSFSNDPHGFSSSRNERDGGCYRQYDTAKNNSYSNYPSSQSRGTGSDRFREIQNYRSHPNHSSAPY